MIQMSMKLDMTKTNASMAQIQKQIPFATSLALNGVANQARIDVGRALPQLIDRPTPYTKKSLQFEKATKKNLVAYVGFAGAGFGQMPSGKGRIGFPASEYTRRLEKGGQRVPASGRSAFLLPGQYANKSGENIVDRFGNISRGRGQKIKNLITKAKAGKGNYFYGKPKGKPAAPAGVWKRMGADGQGRIVLLFHFGNRAQYSGNQLQFGPRVHASVRKNFKAKFASAMRKALRSAR